MSTLEELSTRALSNDPSQPSIEYQGRWIGWGEMRQVADRVNGLIEASGADPKAPVALIPRNRPHTLAALIGLTARPRHISMIHVYQSPVGIARDIVRLKPAVVVAAAEDMSDEVRSALAAHGIAGIALSGMDAEAVPGRERSTALCDPPPPSSQIDLLTSGTTGPPKQFALTYDMIAKHMIGGNVMGVSSPAEAAKLPPMLLFYPFGNFSGLYATLPPILMGVRGVLVDRFTLEGWLDYVRRFRPQIGAVPTSALQTILENNIPQAEFASMHAFMTGAAPLDPSVQRAFEERYGLPVLLAYGATEFGGPVSIMTLDLYKEWGQKKFGSVGRPCAGAQLHVIDPETGAVLPPNTQGLLELIVPRMGPNWIRTSDVVVLDEDGFVWHKGRADGAIVRGGFKLLPDNIERALKLHEAVSAAGVTGIPDKRLGQVPAAAIQLKPGAARPTIAELEKHLRNHVEATHIPVTWRFVETLPYTAMVKVDRAALRRLFETTDEHGAPRQTHGA
jgi:long-chain acyl-CoA synthetase